MEKPPRRRKTTAPKKHRYAKAMLALFCIFCLVIAALLFLLWQGLARYETTTPRAAMDGYFSLLAEKQYAALQAQADFSPSAMDSWEDYYAFLHSRFGEKPGGFRYRRVAGTAEGQHYAVYEGEEKRGELALYADKEAPHHWRVSAITDLQAPYTVTAPGHATVLANGQPLNAGAEGVTRELLAGFEALPEEARPLLLHYPLEPSLQTPVFTATGPGGLPCDITTDSAAATALVTVPLEEEAAAEYTARLEAAAKSYATFVTDDNTLGDLQTYLYPGTELASRMAGFYRGWYLEHQGYDFQNMQIQSLTSTSTNTFSGEITFDYLVYQYGTTHSFPTRYLMYFALYEGNWRLLELQVR